MGSTLAAVGDDWSWCFDAITDALCLVDSHGTVRRCNKAFAVLVGRTPTEIAGLDCCTLIHGGPDPPPEWPLPKAFETRAHQEAEYLLGGRWVRAAADPTFDEAGALVGAVHSLAVIDGRKRAEEALKRSLAWQEAIFEGSRDAILISDAESRFTAVNSAAGELTGYSRDELLRMRIPDLFEDVDLLAYEALHNRVLAGEELESEARIRRKDGRKVDAEFNSRRVVIGGASYMHTVARDVTERKRREAALLQNESELRAMFELASIGIAQADPRTGRWLRVNQKMCAITGYTAEELLGLRIPDLTHPDDRQEDVDLFQRVVRGEAADYRLEKRYIRKDGSVIWVNVNMTVIRDPSGLPIRTVATIEDVTERKRAEKALFERNRELTETLRQLEQSRTMLQMIIESVPARVFWKDRESQLPGLQQPLRPRRRVGRSPTARGQGRFRHGVERAGRALPSGRPRGHGVRPSQDEHRGTANHTGREHDLAEHEQGAAEEGRR